MEQEEWKPVVGLEGYFEVSNYGRVKSLDRRVYRKDGQWRDRKGQLIKQFPNWFGYLLVGLQVDKNKKTLATHRLVAISYVSNPNGLKEVNHKDGNKLNNRADNLEWCTRSQNMLHCFRVLGHKSALLNVKGKQHHLSVPIKAIYPTGEAKIFDSKTEAANELKCSISTITNSLNGTSLNRKNISFELVAE